MDFVWTTQEKENFYKTNHMDRYFTCCASVNPPAAYAPLYKIQPYCHKYHALWATTPDSIVVMRNRELGKYFVLRASTLQRQVGMKSDRLRVCGGPAPHLRLGTFRNHDLDMVPRLRRYECGSNLEGVYKEVKKICESGMEATNWKTIVDLLPKAMDPEEGQDLFKKAEP